MSKSKYTEHYKELKKRLNQLEKQLIPKTSTTGSYTLRQIDSIRSYRLLVHAELEWYFENVATDIVKYALDKWLTKGKSSKVLTSLLTYTDLDYSLKQKHPNVNKYVNLTDRIHRVVSKYTGAIRQNHGIKEENLLGILVPIGFDIDSFDQSWLATMSSFGENRGATAHKSYKVQQPIDPVSEVNTVNLILSETKKIDEELLR